MPEATHMECPEKPGLSHHLKPKRDRMVCAYCGKSRAQIESEAPTKIIPTEFKIQRAPRPPQHRR